MQTFLPYADFEKSAQVLDRLRLNKQAIEVTQLIHAMRWPDEAPKSIVGHPCKQMWDGYMPALLRYGWVCRMEWERRGYNGGLTTRKLVNWSLDIDFDLVHDTYHLPPWFGEAHGLHAFWRARLLEKDPVHYGQFGWTEAPIKEFPWPNR